MQDKLANSVEIDEKEKTNEATDAKVLDIIKNATRLGFRLRVDQLTHIDTNKQQYGVKGMLDRDWLASENDIKSFKEKEEGYTPEYVPQIDVVNASDELMFEDEIFDNTKTKFNIVEGYFDYDNNLYNRQRIIINLIFTQEFDVSNFPFCVQDLTCQFVVASEPVNELIFSTFHTEPDTITINKTFSSLTEWNIIGVDASQAFVDETLARSNGAEKGAITDTYAYVAFRIQVERKFERILERIGLWSFIFGLLSLCMFAIKPEDIEARLTFVITLILTIVASQFITNSELPAVPYLTLIDKYNLFIMLFILILCIESVFVGYFSNHDNAVEDEDELDRLSSFDTTFAISAMVLFLLSHIGWYFIGRRAYQIERAKISKPMDLNQQIMTNLELQNTQKLPYQVYM